MLAEFSERFPEVMLPLIHERDVYLAWSLSRSKAVRAMLLVQEKMCIHLLLHEREHARPIRVECGECR